MMACSVTHPAVVYENQQYISSVTVRSSSNQQQQPDWEAQQVERLRRLSMMSRTSSEESCGSRHSSGRSSPRRRISHGSDHSETDCPVRTGAVVYVQGSDGHFIPACPIGYAFHYLDVKQRYKKYFDASGSSTVAIDNKIEQAMDLVKSHLMFAVREEVDVLKERITELMDRISQLEYENSILRAQASQETLAQLGSKTTTTNS